MFKKFLGVLCVLLLATFPAFAEESLPAPISIHIETQLGANLVPDILALNFVNLNVPFVDEWVDADAVINWELSWRGGVGSGQLLVCELTLPLTNGDESITLDPATNIQQIWTSVDMPSINVTLPGPPGDGSQQDIAPIASSVGSGTAQLQMQFFNKIALPGMIIDGEFTYTILTGL